jgi:hypothetical protein
MASAAHASMGDCGGGSFELLATSPFGGVLDAHGQADLDAPEPAPGLSLGQPDSRAAPGRRRALPVVETSKGSVFDNQRHGTAFFISEVGLFLTAAHVIEDSPNVAPPLRVIIMSAYGMAIMPVAFITRHPSFDVALGVAVIDPHQRTKISPLTLSRKPLASGDHVAVLGYQNSQTHYSEDADGTPLSKFTFTPDFYEGDVLDVHRATRTSSASRRIEAPARFH